MSSQTMERNLEKRAYAQLDGTYEQYLAWCEKYDTRPRKFERWLKGQLGTIAEGREVLAYHAAAERLRRIVAR